MWEDVVAECIYKRVRIHPQGYTKRATANAPGAIAGTFLQYSTSLKIQFSATRNATDVMSLRKANLRFLVRGALYLETWSLLIFHRKLRPWYACSTSPPPKLNGLVLTCPPTDIFVDNVHIELSLWDTAGQEEFDRLRSLSYDDTHTIMLCFSVDSKDSLENVESKWVGEIAENCQGVKLVLVALKCDLRERGGDEEDDAGTRAGKEKVMIDYKQGLEVAKRIQALRYLGTSRPSSS